MKNYVAPEMEMLAFAAKEPVAGIIGDILSGDDDTRFNDGRFGSWK